MRVHVIEIIILVNVVLSILLFQEFFFFLLLLVLLFIFFFVSNIVKIECSLAKKQQSNLKTYTQAAVSLKRTTQSKSLIYLAIHDKTELEVSLIKSLTISTMRT